MPTASGSVLRKQECSRLFFFFPQLWEMLLAEQGADRVFANIFAVLNVYLPVQLFPMTFSSLLLN